MRQRCLQRQQRVREHADGSVHGISSCCSSCLAQSRPAGTDNRKQGNTIFLALGTAHLPYGSSTLWLKALVSIASFWAGCFCFGQTRRIGNKRKGTLGLSFLVQSLLILISAALSQGGVVPAFGMSFLGSEASSLLLKSHETNAMSMAPLALMAFQFGGQIVTSRVLGFNEVPTNVLTSLYCDLLSDPLLLAPVGANVKRNRRLVAIVLMMVGGVLGAWLQRSSAGMPAALWIAGAVKLGISLGWVLWQGKPISREEKGTGKV